MNSTVGLLEWATANPSPILANVPWSVLDRVCSAGPGDGSDGEAQDALVLWAMVLADGLD